MDCKDAALENPNRPVLHVGDKKLRIQNLEKSMGSLVKTFGKLLKEVGKQHRKSLVDNHGSYKKVGRRRCGLVQ